MKYTLIFMRVALMAVGSTEVENSEQKPKKVEQLVEITDGIYTEWYPGKKQVKYRGGQDEHNRRHGKWTFYSENGLELSMTFYSNGLKEGFTIVKYPTGAIHYRGEYKNDQMVGTWTTFDEKGKVITEKEYGYPKE